MSYRPRRQNKRWLDGDCPAEVLCIYDNKGQSCDRYTVYYTHMFFDDFREQNMLFGRAMSSAPCSPQGVGLSIEHATWEVANWRYRVRHQAAKWSSLPEAVKACVRADIAAFAKQEAA